MWDDAVLVQGRHTKRKWNYVCALLLIAALGIFGALLLELPIISQRAVEWIQSRISPTAAEDWIELSWCGDVTALTGDRIVSAGEGQVCIFSLEGQLIQRLDADFKDPVAASAGDYAVVFEPSGNELLFITPEDCEIRSIPTGVDGAAVSPRGQLAVITAGSGYLTETKLFSPEGECLNSIGLTDGAMAMIVFLSDGTLASCCVSAEGRWYLRLDRGEAYQEILLGTALVYDIKACANGVALWTSDGIQFFSSTGTALGEFRLNSDAILDWACGDCAALLVRRYGSCRLMTVTPEGTTQESAPLERPPEALSVCANRVCLLDSEALLVYDNSCTLKRRAQCGARAGEILTAESCVFLLGDRELLRILNS